MYYRLVSQLARSSVRLSASPRLLSARSILNDRRTMVSVNIDKKNPSTVVLLTAEHLKKKNEKVTLQDAESTFIKINNECIEGESAVSRYLARAFPKAGLYGSSALESSQVDSWMDFSNLYLKNSTEISSALLELNRSLAPATYLVGQSFTLADFAVWAALNGNSRWSNLLDSGKAETHISRWFNFCAKQDPFKKQTKVGSKASNDKSKPADKKGLKVTMEDGGKFFELPGAEKGKVVVRFPPEASGYLHIGHAKAALMNQYYKELYEGKLIMRFDDTNPAKENAHYEDIILEDIKLLHLTPDRYTRTSDYFDLMYTYAEQMIKQGDAFCDDTALEEMRKLREERTPSSRRDLSVEENLRIFQEMKKGSDEGKRYCLRAKIDYKSDNGCLRDPVMYRCRDEEHLIHGKSHVAYPTYDFACPIVDSIEDVTHALRTSEYLDRDQQYYWVLEKLGLRKPYIYSYSRLALINTVLSKRKLTYLVNEGFVDGWNDPRFPTVRGIIRRGMTIEGLKQFIVAQGSSKSNVHMEWDKIWSFNKKVIDPIAPRFNALEKSKVVPVLVNGASESSKEYPKHPKNTEIGQKQVYYAPKILMEGEDAKEVKEGDLVTFINWGNLRVSKINKSGDSITSVEVNTELENTDFKKTLKVTWLAENSKAPYVPTKCVFFDNIIDKADLTREDDFKEHINKNTRVRYNICDVLKEKDTSQDVDVKNQSEMDMLGDPCLKDLKKGDIIQLQRRGYFICDEPYGDASRHSGRESPCILFHIPDGTSAGMMNQSKDKPKNTGGSSSKEKTGASKKQSKKSATSQQQQRSASTNAVSHTPEQQKLFDSIVKQGDVIRTLKSSGGSKEDITKEVGVLKTLKAQYKDSTGQEFVNSNAPAAPASTKQQRPASTNAVSHTPEQQKLFDSIVKQGDVIRTLKSSGGSKEDITKEVGVLKTLKAQYKDSTGQEFVNSNAPAAPASSKQKKNKENGGKSNGGKTNMAPVPVSSTATTPTSPEVAELVKKITEQGDKIRSLKNAKASKETIQPEVDELLKLKAGYKTLTGSDYQPANAARSSSGGNKKEKKPKENAAAKKEKPAKKQQETQQQAAVDSAVKKMTRLGLEAQKETNLSDWYSQVITKSELIEYYDVSGCYILRPWAFGMWERIQAFFDKKIKDIGVENCYFPMFVSNAALEKEKTHIEDFAPEVAWVTRSGQSELAEPIAIRPTSETVMYPSYAKWVQSHRDLPIRLNQWCNVVRWEFKHPQPFLRTREFLWQEGHTAFATRQEAVEEVHQILGFYSQVYTDLLAIPVVKGKKTEKEKFAGGDFTTTIEAYIHASGRAIQAATSHHLGQNFSKMFDIEFEDPSKPDSKEKINAYQNSWGLTTRSIGVLVMVHGDNKGLVLPPNIANIQVVIVPVGLTATLSEEKRKLVNDTCAEYKNILSNGDIRVRLDNRENYSPGWKFNHWELKGVPIRVEIGPRDIENSQFVAVRRDTGEKISLKKDECLNKLSGLLTTIQSDMFDKANKQLVDNMAVTKSWEDFNNKLAEGKEKGTSQDVDVKNQIIQAPYCGECEDQIKKDSAREEVAEGAPSMGAKGLCIPFEQPAEITNEKCIHPSCGKPAIHYTLFGRSY